MHGDVNKLTPKASSGIEAFWQDAAERKEFGPAVDVEFDSETGRLVLIRKQPKEFLGEHKAKRVYCPCNAMDAGFHRR